MKKIEFVHILTQEEEINLKRLIGKSLFSILSNSISIEPNKPEILKFYKEAENYPKIFVNPVITFQEDTTVIDSSVFLTLKYYRLQPFTRDRLRFEAFLANRPNHPRHAIAAKL